MNSLAAFLLGLAISASIALLLVMYIRPHLRKVLVDLCGTAERANFWTAFANIGLVLAPVIFAMSSYPQATDGKTLVFELSNQLKWSLVGFAFSLMILGAVLIIFFSIASTRGDSVNKREG